MKARLLAFAFALLLAFPTVAAAAEADEEEFDPSHEFEQHEWIPIHIGGLDLSVTKAVAYLILGSLVTMALGILLMRVRLRVDPDRRDFKVTYEPGNPAADAQGYVKEPNVDSLVEALDLKEAQRAYEANLNVIETARAMETRTLDLLKK